ncbi:MAG: hypothetical protein RI906_1106 [Pseudomonadota bacterium]|jgi:hypothetical protein
MPLIDRSFSDIITFTRASSATYFDATGTLQTATTDVPRFDYDPSTLAAQGLLIEEARTNILTQSTNFSSGWSITAATLTANVTASPDGTTNAASIIENLTTSVRALSQSATITAGQTITASLFVKQTGGATRHFRIQISSNAGANGFRAYFDLATNTVNSSVAFGTGTLVANSAVITPIRNGWYRISVSGTVDPAATSASSIGFMQDTAGGSASYTGNGTSGLFLWGAQLEAGAFPTSYIPTTTTALTRAADVASVNTLSPWYNATATTLYTEFNTPVPTTVTASAVVAGFDDGTANNRFSNFYTSNTGVIAANQTIAGAPSFTISGASGLTLSNVQKAAARYQAGSYAMSVNGAAAVTDAFASAPPTVNTLRFGLRPSGTQANMWLRRVTVYPRGMSNAELQAITK